MKVGTILSSTSHCSYTGRVFSESDERPAPHPQDYHFGQFVRVAVPHELRTEEAPVLLSQKNNAQPSIDFVVGIITKSIQTSPSSSPTRVSTHTQNALLAPDYVAEKGVHLSLTLIGTMQVQISSAQGGHEVYRCTQGVPPLFLKGGSVIETMRPEEVRAFHLFAGPNLAEEEPLLSLDYLIVLRTLPSTLHPFLLLQILNQVETVLPEWKSHLSLLKRNVSWPLKITRMQ